MQSKEQAYKEWFKKAEEDELSIKVHDLLEFETLLLEHIKDISELHPDLVSLNRYYIETRYPGDYPESTLADAQKAYGSATKIKAFVFLYV